jgi:predicted amidophosphoribosyltransferase
VGCRARGSALCGRCARFLRAPVRPEGVESVDRVLAALEYDGHARSLVLALKLSGRRAAADPLVDAMWAIAVSEGLAGTILTWVPGRSLDGRRRGFDHAHLLASQLAPRLGLPAARLLERRGDRPDQTSLSASRRRTNVLGAFAARSSPARVVLVDDLVTTGATASACARALRACGARSVELLAACRA